MFMIFLSFYLYSVAVKVGCSMLAVEWKASFFLSLDTNKVDQF